MKHNTFQFFIRVYLLAFSVILSPVVHSQLIPDFKAEITKGCAPQVVKFVDLTQGNPTSWAWDLGNGITSTEQNPTTFYFDAGQYTVKLVVKNANGTETVVKDQYITLYGLPDISFTVSDSVGCFPLGVRFTDLSKPVSGTIASRQWDFGDGTFDGNMTARHNYNVAGSFAITLKVTNSFGCTQIISKPDFIKVLEGVTADFGYVSALSCNPPTNIQFNDSSIGKDINRYLWDFGDGSIVSGKNPVHAYTLPGSYSVTHIITNMDGCSDTIVKPNLVQVNSVKASFTFPDTVCQNAPVTFLNTSTPVSGSVLWSFGDGTTSTVPNPVKTFSTPGTYTVKLVGKFGPCSDSISHVVVVLPLPSADFSVSSPQGSCNSPITVTFENIAAGIINYLWDFGDGTTATTSNPTHTYNVQGSFDVSLKVTGSNGCAAEVTKSNLIYFGPPRINGFNDLPYKGCSPYTANLVANIATPEPVVSYLWDFGDGTTSTETTPQHTFINSGSYTISLTIATVNGCTATFTLPGAVVLSEKPTANFSATPTTACAFQLINFSNLSSQNVTSYIWSFGDGGTSTEQNPIYSYIDTGMFNVTLVASNNACKDTVTFKDLMRINPPIARFKSSFTCDKPRVRVFTESSIGAETWLWNFGDGNSSTEQNPIHTYASPGTYTATLEVSNGECKHTQKEIITIIDDDPELKVNVTALCELATAQFSVEGIEAANIALYTWKFGNGSTAETTLPSVSYGYPATGVFLANVIVTYVNGCSDSAQQLVTIHINGPKANFNVNGGTCVRKTVTINDLSQSSDANPITKWIWNYGDGTIATLTAPPFSHVYQKPGLFDVALILTDSYGCVDTLVKPKAVLITKPVAETSIIDSLNCINNVVRFKNVSTGFQLSQTWDLGDGTTSNRRELSHAYIKEGSYNIKLVITDTFGCKDSIIRVNAVKVVDVKAGLKLGDTLSSCPPFILTVKNQSENYSSVLWDFGDGSFSNLDSPSHYYNVIGDYTIKLLAKGYGSCIDSAITKISVKGPSGSFLYNPVNICSPGVVSFSARTTNLATFIWDFGDGIILTTSDSTVQYTYVDAGKYTPKLLLRDIAGCQVPIAGKDTITIATLEAHMKSMPALFCDSATVQFYDSSTATLDTITNYLWRYGDGASDTARNPMHKYSSPGNYPVSLIVTTKNGCSDTANLVSNFKVVKSPRISLTGSTKVCVNDPVSFKVQLQPQDSPIVTWRWNFGNGDTSMAKDPPVQYYSNAGVYNVSALAINSSGCSDTVSIPIEAFPLPIVNAGVDTTICLGQAVILKPTGAAVYKWNADPSLSCTNCAKPVAKPSNLLVKYIVNGTTAQGCKNVDSISIRVIQRFVISQSPGDTLCLGETTALFASGSDTYSWWPVTGLNNPAIPNPVAKPDTTTNYRVIVSDKQKCFNDTAFVRVVVYPVPKFNILQQDITLAVGDNVALNTTASPDITRWRWTPYVGLNCHDCPTPLAAPRNSTTYRAQVWNDGGCTTEDQVTITIICNNTNIYIPNTFSPNADGMNDVFYTRGKGIATVKAFTIFNRWGHVVYQKTNTNINDPQAGWNGTQNGVQLSPDVFVYKIDIVCENSEVFTLTGNVTLIR